MGAPSSSAGIAWTAPSTATRSRTSEGSGTPGWKAYEVNREATSHTFSDVGSASNPNSAMCREDPVISSAYATAKEDTDQTSSAMRGAYVPYDPSSLSYAARKAEHAQFVRAAVDAAGAADMALYVGEYGIMNPCNGGDLAHSTRYARDTYAIYESLGLSRTVWTHGYWDDMAIWWREAGWCGHGTRKLLPLRGRPDRWGRARLAVGGRSGVTLRPV